MREPGRIINYWKKEKLIVLYIVILGLSFNISMVLGPIYQGRLIDSIVGGSSLSAVIKLAAAFVALIGAIQLLRYFKRFYIRRFANITSATMRLMIYNNIMHKSITELDNEDIGDLMTRSVSDVDLCVEGMRRFTMEIFDTGILMVSYVTSMLFYDVKITLLTCIFIPAAYVLAEKLRSIIYKYSIAFRQKSSEITGITYDAVENAMMYRANGLETLNCKSYAEELEELKNRAIKANILENSMQPVYNVIAMLGVISAIYFCGIHVVRGEWTVGSFVTYITMFAALANKASKAAKLFNSIQRSQVSWKRVKPYLTEYRSKDTACSVDGDSSGLSVANLGFSYPAANNTVIENISFEAKPGEIIGITGPIASGKSALGLSLLGMYPYLGSIKINGRELKDYSEFERSRLIAYLGHKPQLLSDSIYNNITLGNGQDVGAVLKAVCFEDELAAMCKGQDTVVGSSGIRLSGGQQARIALARTLLQKSKIIILDDPFSAVDMKTEEKIIGNLRSQCKNSIILIISHRLAIFDKVDRVILLHGDKSACYGTHRELMETSGLYAAIYNLQCMEGGEDNKS